MPTSTTTAAASTALSPASGACTGSPPGMPSSTRQPPAEIAACFGVRGLLTSPEALLLLVACVKIEKGLVRRGRGRKGALVGVHDIDPGSGA